LSNDIRSGRRSIEQLVDLLRRPLKWYKIVPTIEIGKWDPIVNRFAPKTIVFHVRTFTIASKFPYAPRGRTPGNVKKYDYLFTGRNRDILDWNINFNTLYLMAVTSGLNKVVQGATGAGLNPAGQGATPGIPTSTQQTLSAQSDQVAAPGTAIIPGNINTNVLSASNPQKAEAAANLGKSLLIDSRGDMIELELKIIGDPHFIKQDDVFYSRPSAGQDATLTPNKSLYMDAGELYVFVNFISPVDYNEEKGLAEVKANEILDNEQNIIGSKNLGYSNFSGVYKIITVDSTFSRGRFEQILRMAKVLYDQTGAPANIDRQEQQSTLKLVVATEYSAGDRLTNNIPNEYYSDASFVSAFLQNNDRLNTIDDTLTTSAIVSRNVFSDQLTFSASDEDISTINQPITQASISNPAPIINADWSIDSTALG
jgi:hypothetical protein